MPGPALSQRLRADPGRRQAVGDTLSTAHIQAVFATWRARRPLPRTPADRQAGSEYRRSIWQREVSRTQGVAAPAHGRAVFEEVIRENLDLGRPDRGQVLVARRVQTTTPGVLRTRVVQAGVLPRLPSADTHGHLTQSFTAGWARRTEMTSTDPTDLGVQTDRRTRPSLTPVGRAVNRRRLAVQRLRQAGAVSGERSDRVGQPPVTQDGQRASGRRCGDRRVLVVLAARIVLRHLPTALTHRPVRQQVAPARGLDRTASTAGQMTAALRRRRLQGRLGRLPQRQRYRVTA